MYEVTNVEIREVKIVRKDPSAYKKQQKEEKILSHQLLPTTTTCARINTR